jgi:hypothetical protein
MKKRRTHIIEDETVMDLRDEDWDVAVVFWWRRESNIMQSQKATQP